MSQDAATFISWIEYTNLAANSNQAANLQTSTAGTAS
jgi:hypothetical protein